MAYQAAAQLQALADPTRRAIFERLARKPAAVGELADDFPISRPAVSQHLRVLKDAQLVLHDRTGTQNIYRIDREGLAKLRAYLDAMWEQALQSLKRVAESTSPSSRKESR